MINGTNLNVNDEFVDSDDHRDKFIVIMIGRNGKLLGSLPDDCDADDFPDVRDIIYRNYIVYYGLGSSNYYWTPANSSSWEGYTLTTKNNSTKDNQMSNTVVDGIVNRNKDNFKLAATIESGSVAMNVLVKALRKRLPKEFANSLDTPWGKLVAINLLSLAADHFAPENELLDQLCSGAMVAAYQGQIKVLDLSGLIDGIMSDPGVKKLSKTL